MSQLFLEKVVLLSSAVADADNQVSTSGKKLELLLALANSISTLSKAEIQPAQKKIEDLALRILFQNCPAVLLSPLVAVLNGMYTRGSSAGMHACVAFLLQLACGNTLNPDRPLPFEDRESLSFAERSACLSVAAGIVVLRGPSAAYFVPNIVGVVSKHIRFPDCLPRAEALRNLAKTIDSVGLPAALLVDVWKGVLHKPLLADPAASVRLAAAMCTVAICREAAALNPVADQIQGVAMKGITDEIDEVKKVHVEILQKLLYTYSSRNLVTDSGKAGSIKSHVHSFASLLGWLAGTARKHRREIPVLEALAIVAQPIGEEEVIAMGIFLATEIAQFSVPIATRAVSRVITKLCVGDAGVLRFAREVLLPNISHHNEHIVCVCLAGLTDCISVVEGSVVALDDKFSDLLVAIVTDPARSLSVVNLASFALRAYSHAVPSQAFPLVNILFNHLRIDLMSGQNTLHLCVALSAVLCECSDSVPEDVADAIVATATQLFDSEDSSIFSWQKKSCGCILLLPLVRRPSVLMDLVAVWKCVLGKESKKIDDKNEGVAIEHLQAVLNAIRLLRVFLETVATSNVVKLAVVFLNNAWQIVQQPKSVLSMTIVGNIRSELLTALLAMNLEDYESLHRPLVVYLSAVACEDVVPLVACLGCSDDALDEPEETQLFMEQFYHMHPTAPGSPLCPQLPFAPWLSPTRGLANQMTHYTLDGQIGSIKLLARLMVATNSPNTVLLTAFRADEQKNLPKVATFFLIFINCPVSESILAEAATTGLKSEHALIRRLAAKLIAKSYSENTQSVGNLILECAGSTCVTLRSAAALIIGYLDVHAVTQYFPTLIKLARELSQPLRACALWAIHAGCLTGQTSLAPWVRDILRIALAHTVADVYSIGVIRLLLARILTGVVAASFGLSRPEMARTDLIWEAVRQDESSEVVCAALAYASRVDPTSVSHGMYVVSTLSRSDSALHAIQGLTEMTEQGLVLGKSDIFSILFELSDKDRCLRGPIDRLLKVLLRATPGEGMDLILAAMSRKDDNAEESTGEENMRDEDDYAEEREHHVASSPIGATAKSIVMSVPTRTLAVKCLNRIMKSPAGFAPAARWVDPLVHIAAASTNSNSEPLQIQGAKMLWHIVTLWGPAFRNSLLQFETQISAPIRQGIRANSEACREVQELSLKMAKKLIELNLTTAPEKLTELLMHPFEGEPCHDWPTYFSLRGNTLGRQAQSNERDLTRLLYLRLDVVVDVLADCSQIHYYLLRLLVDAAILGNTGAPKLRLFSVLPGAQGFVDLPLLRSVVVRGLAKTKMLKAPSDCPIPDLDFEALYVGVAMQAVESISVAAALQIAFDLGYPDVLSLVRIKGLGDTLVREHPVWAESHLEIVWSNSVDNATTVWLAKRGFFDDRISDLVALVYSQMADLGPAMALWKELLEIWQGKQNDELVECLVGYLQQDVKLSLVLIVTLMAPTFVLAPRKCVMLRHSLIQALERDEQSVIQAVSKMLSLTYSTDIFQNFFLPLVLEIIPCGAPQLLRLLVSAAGPHTKAPEYRQLVRLVLSLAEDGETVVLCLQQSPDVFKQCLNELESKTKIEALVRAHLPQKIETQKVEEAPQIQLKLKF